MSSLVYRQPSTKMDFILYIFFVLGAALFNCAQETTMCDFTDSKCLINGAKNVYRSIIPKIEPLHIDKIEGNIYQLTNVTLAGMGNCEVIHMSINTENLNYDERLSCPELILNFKYQVKGNLGQIHLDETGLGQITAIEYIIIIKGKHGHFVAEKDQNHHYVIETNPKGKLIFNARERIFKDKDNILEALTYLHQNKFEVDKYLRSNIIEKFMATVVAGISAGVRERTQEEMFPKIDKSVLNQVVEV